MKITDPEVIKNGEKDLITSIQEDLDPEAVKKILKDRLTATALAPKGGSIVVHDNQIAFRLDFEINVSGSLLFDRDGNFIDDMAEAGPEDPGLDEMGLDDDPDQPPEEDQARDLDLPPLEAPEEVTEDIGAQDGLVDDLTIDLPDYDSDDEAEAEDLLGEEPEEGLDLALEELDEDADSGALEDIDLEEEPDPEDSMDDILKESRDFWEQKNGS